MSVGTFGGFAHGNDIDAVVERLNTVVDEARAKHSRLGFFAAAYVQMTVAVKRGIDAGAFDDGERMSSFAAAFAGHYFDALTAWHADAGTKRSWRVAFQAAERPDRLILQNVVLGMNAHINLDLAVSAAEASSGADIAGFKRDFDRINHVIASILDSVQDAISRFSPLLGVLDRVGGRTDDHLLNWSIRVGRDESWRQAVLLAHQDDEQRLQAIDLLDRKVALLGQIVDEPGGLLAHALEVIRSTESSDVVAVIDGLRAVPPPTVS